MSITAQFKLKLTDVRAKALDLNANIYFTVTGETFEDIRQAAQEVQRDVSAFVNLDSEDRVELEEFIK